MNGCVENDALEIPIQPRTAFLESLENQRESGGTEQQFEISLAIDDEERRVISEWLALGRVMPASK